MSRLRPHPRTRRRPDRHPDHAPARLRAITWSIAGTLAFLYLAFTVAAAWPGAQAAATGAAPSSGPTTAHTMLWASAVWLGLALPAWLMAGIAERAPAVGLRRMSARQLLAASCAVFCLAEAPMFFVSALFALARTHSRTLTAYSGGSGGSTLLGDVASSIAAGISEEIVVLVLPVLLAWRIGEVLTGVRLRRRGLLVLVVALTAVRLSYHLEYGLAAVPLAPWAAISVLLYLRSRAVLPLMLGHAAFDVTLALVNRIAIRHGLAPAVTVFAVLTAVAFTTALGLVPRVGRQLTRAA
ncbi:hypothetical protein ACFV4M_10740 [Kitasatospora indigofera]|uniref:hypothetical protein n=1 Tax=Kitasatospora indigofera TaxID=67307 RepID=UPI00365EA02D